MKSNNVSDHLAPRRCRQGPAWKEMMQDRRMTSDLMREEEKTYNLETPGQCRREVLSKEGETTKINFSWFVV